MVIHVALFYKCYTLKSWVHSEQFPLRFTIVTFAITIFFIYNSILSSLNVRFYLYNDKITILNPIKQWFVSKFHNNYIKQCDGKKLINILVIKPQHCVMKTKCYVCVLRPLHTRCWIMKWFRINRLRDIKIPENCKHVVYYLVLI